MPPGVPGAWGGVLGSAGSAAVGDVWSCCSVVDLTESVAHTRKMKRSTATARITVAPADSLGICTLHPSFPGFFEIGGAKEINISNKTLYVKRVDDFCKYYFEVLTWAGRKTLAPME